MAEFRKVVVPDEIEALCDFDRKAFSLYPQDVFPPQLWEKCESYWMIADGKIVGCSAFLLNADYDAQPRSGCLCIESTGVLPEFQGRGFGRQQKEWQIRYARDGGFDPIVTIMRQSNTRIVRLNEKLGFTVRKIDNHYYPDGEPGIVMELNLPAPVCPRCGKALRTRRAKQCRFCHADWH